MINLKLDSNKFISKIYSETLIEELNKIFELFNFDKSIYIKFFRDKSEIEKILGHSVPTWIKGVAIDNYVYILEYNDMSYKNKREFEKVIIHEIVHIVVDFSIRGSYPQWLNEGLAVVLAKQHENMQYTKILDLDVKNLGYNDDFYYEKCCAATMKYIDKYGIKSFIKKLIDDEIKFDSQ
ncbi:peptidase MA superfamily [Gottschalkia purinilytica]|uniref:Peptidase MA superfamily n=1 Tax=Gottschalkia purinilytica TaxID=1503 RepID=A0A0L0W7M1_GOTPU|nr:hypothetical protein [Gottschalkia purinilytica]KNF07558.1 peptidase MA superfamily [Gottschalkia purinilytica]